MINILVKIFGYLFSFWADLSPEAKEKIINAIVDIFESVFRKLFKENKA